MFAFMIKLSRVHLNICNRCNKQMVFSGQNNISENNSRFKVKKHWATF